MVSLRVVLTTAVLALLSSTVQCTTYYVSQSLGFDRNAGTSVASPWKTFQPIYQRATAFRPGDSILFCQGEKWFYSPLLALAQATADRPITWGSYQCRNGQTDKPIISPAVSIPANAWSISSDNSNVLVYSLAGDSVATANGIKAIWAGEIRHLPARTPNLIDPTITYGQQQSEFYFANPTTITGNLINCAALTQANGYWVGAVIYMRVNNWTYQQTVVIASGPGWLQVQNAPGSGSCSGFYLENPAAGSFVTVPLLQVDAPGEWVYNRNDNKLYLWPASDSLRQQLLAGTAGTYFTYGNTAAAATISAANHIIQDLHFMYGNGGIINSGSSTFTVRRNTIKSVTMWGIVTSNAAAAEISYNVVDDADGDCILIDSYGGSALYNNVSRCGMIAGYGFSVGATNNGITAHSSTVNYNMITGVGYNGIEPHYGTYVSFNVITDVMKTLNDGGGIYMFGSSGNGLVLESNTINVVTGNWLSWSIWSIASCVFTDQGTSSITIYNNTCSNAPQCMQLNDATGNTILSNRCNSPGLYMNDGVSGGNHMVIGNVVQTPGTDSILQNPLARIYAPGQINLNGVFTAYYLNTYCQSAINGNYLYQKDFGANGVWRFWSYTDWVNHECNLLGKAPGSCPFESGSAMYVNNCQSYHPYYFYTSDVETLVQDLKNRQAVQNAGSSSSNAAEIAAPVVASIVAVTLVIVLAIVGSRYYMKMKAARAAAAADNIVPLSELSNRPQSPDVSMAFDFSALSSPHSTMAVELHPIQSL